MTIWEAMTMLGGVGLFLHLPGSVAQVDDETVGILTEPDQRIVGQGCHRAEAGFQLGDVDQEVLDNFLSQLDQEIAFENENKYE